MTCVCTLNFNEKNEMNKLIDEKMPYTWPGNESARFYILTIGWLFNINYFKVQNLSVISCYLIVLIYYL